MLGNQKAQECLVAAESPSSGGLTVEGSEGPDCKNSECQGPNGLDLVQRAVGSASGFRKGSSCQKLGTVLSSGDTGTS